MTLVTISSTFWRNASSEACSFTRANRTSASVTSGQASLSSGWVISRETIGS
jgi:hypothetical protein